MPGTRHTLAGRVGAEGKGQGSEGGLQLEGSAKGAVCVCVCDCSPAHDPRHACSGRLAKEGPPGPLHSQSCESWGRLPGIQGVGSIILPKQSPHGGGATSLCADPEQPKDADQEPRKWSFERVDLWSSCLGECMLCGHRWAFWE